MGGGNWSSDFYRDQEAERERSGRQAFAYNHVVSQQRHEDRKVHASMDPKGVAFRESRDSEEHPESNAIMVWFDVTGSMGRIPTVLREKLPNLMDTLNNGSYIPHPQLFFGAVGDDVSDRGPLQVGQFESDNRVNEAFENMWLEGNGGGTMHESYQNAIYFAARHTAIDCWEKRQKKGYLFLIGDELPYDVVSRTRLEGLLGVDPQENIPIETIIREAQERFNIFFLIPTHTSHGRNPNIRARWEALLSPENVLMLEDADSVCETIAITIGLCEGTVDIDTAREQLSNNGSSAEHINHAAAAVSNVNGAATEGRTARL